MTKPWPSADGSHLILRTEDGISVLETEGWIEVANHPGCVDAAFVDGGLRLMCDGAVFDVPLIEPDAATILARSGQATNLRVCRDTVRLVPVLPFPDPESVWAPASACGEEGP